MDLFDRVEQILEALRPVFRRQAAFEWFVLLLWGVLLNSQPAAITSYLNTIGLGEEYYHQALHWFHSSAWNVAALCQCWSKWLATHCSGHRLNGQLVYVGDGIKVGKEGNKMPGVKRLHQESADVSKAEWIRGHYFGALGLLLGAGEALFAVPIAIQLQDGIEMVETEQSTLVDKMAALCVQLMSIQLHWDTPDALVQFVLTQLPCGKQIILLSNDVTLSASSVIEAYGWRFKIEVCFRTLIHLLGGFCYRFWLKLMPSAPRWPKDLPLASYPETFRQQVTRKVEAFERFVNLHAIALGILQILSLEHSDLIWRFRIFSWR